MRGEATPGNSRQWQLAAARAHRENSVRARGLHPRQFAPWGGELRSRLCEPLARVRAGGRAIASVKFFDETFLQKSFDLALDLTRRAAQERKLGKQRSAFPGRWRSCPLSHGYAVPAPPEGEPSRCATKSLQKAKSCLPLWGALVPSGDRSGPTEPAGETLAVARAHQENSARARGLHPRQFAPWGSWSPVGTVQDRPSRQARLAAERRACARG